MNKPARLLLAAMIPCALALTGCGKTAVRLSPLPAELTSCADEPLAPALPPRPNFLGADFDPVEADRRQAERDRLTLDYVLALRSWGGDCKAKVQGAKAWNERVGG
jgi:hypothetical protein